MVIAVIIPNHWTLIEPSMRILLLDSKAKSEKEQEEIQNNWNWLNIVMKV